MQSALVFALVLLATWESWQWYFRRILAAPEDGLALMLALVVLAIAGARQTERTPPGRLPLATLAVLLAGYAASRGLAPPIVRAGLAAGLALFCLHVTVLRRQPPVAVWGLAALALPVLPSLQFMLGYPLRLASAVLAVGLIKSHGLAVERHGTMLVWHGAMVEIDAPCSGVTMLWAGLLLTLMGCALLELGAGRTAAAALCSILVAVAGNVLRTISLFYLEIGLGAQIGLSVRPPAWWHEAIGLVAFGLTSVVLLRLLNWMRRRPA
jgi:exosortase/archaeosortase family protein